MQGSFSRLASKCSSRCTLQANSQHTPELSPEHSGAPTWHLLGCDEHRSRGLRLANGGRRGQRGLCICFVLRAVRVALSSTPTCWRHLSCLLKSDYRSRLAALSTICKRPKASQSMRRLIPHWRGLLCQQHFPVQSSQDSCVQFHAWATPEQFADWMLSDSGWAIRGSTNEHWVVTAALSAFVGQPLRSLMHS